MITKRWKPSVQPSVITRKQKLKLDNHFREFMSYYNQITYTEMAVITEVTGADEESSETCECHYHMMGTQFRYSQAYSDPIKV